MYTLSKDYEELYQLIKDGKQVVCFVNYRRRIQPHPLRDVCVVKVMPNSSSIEFFCRGHGYGSVHDFQWKNTDKTEWNWFVAECYDLDVEWIVP